MGLNRFSVHIGTKGKASPHFNYITASEKYEHKKGVVYTQSGNMPRWAWDDPAAFWQAADEFERANGQTYKEHIISIPRELPEYARQRFVNEWLFKEVGMKYPYTYAIHETMASDGKTNPHAHIMFSTRKRDGIERPPEQFFKRYNATHPERGGAKKAETGLSRGEMKNNLEQQRERWTEHNARFARDFGFDLEPRHKPTEPTINKSMAEIQKAQKLDAMLENHPWYISPEPVPKFVPAPPPAPEPPPPPEPTPRGESLAEKYARENAENARMRHDAPQTTPAPNQPEKRPQRENTGYDYDFGM